MPQILHLIEEDVPRFQVEDESNWLAHLDENGFVVIANAANEMEVNEGKRLLWDYLTKNTPLEPNKPETWSDANFSKLGSCREGILSLGTIKQSDFLWFSRLLPSVKKAFSSIYKTDDFLVSFDGASVFRPWQNSKTFEFWKTKSGWFHVDQGRKLRGFHCIQGSIAYTDVNAQTGGFCVIPGSHRFHDELVEVAEGNAYHCEVPDKHHVLSMKQIIPKIYAGDLILWDSRCVHANSPSLTKPIDCPEDEFLRIAAYVCMTPSPLATEEIRTNRINMFESGKGTAIHWPHVMSYKCRPPEPEYKLFDINAVSTEQRQLICGNDFSILAVSRDS